MGRNRPDENEDLVFLGPGISNQEMDLEFKRLYDSLIAYKNNVFHLVDTICADSEERDRLALNIVERDCTLVQQLVAKECSRREMMRAVRKRSVQNSPDEDSKELAVDELLQSRSMVLKVSALADGGD